MLFFKVTSICDLKKPKPTMVLYQRVGIGLLGGVNSHSKTCASAPAEQGTHSMGRGGLCCLKMSVNPLSRQQTRNSLGWEQGLCTRDAALATTGALSRSGVAVTQMGARNS